MKRKTIGRGEGAGCGGSRMGHRHVRVYMAQLLCRDDTHTCGSRGPSAREKRTLQKTKSADILVLYKTSLFTPFFKIDLPSLQKSRQFLC